MAPVPLRTAAVIAARRRAKERADAKADARHRRAEAGWLEWSLIEFARYLYGLALLAVLAFVPLQMADSWLPSGARPVLDPGTVVALALAFDGAVAYLAFLGYRALWREGGPVARVLTRNDARRDSAAKVFRPRASSPAVAAMNVHEVEVENPEHLNVIVGQTHFIKSAEDLHEALVNSVPGIEFGLAFCEASGPCLVRAEGTDAGLKDLAARNALRIGAGHAFVIVLRNAYPINVLRAIRDVPEVVGVFAATSNPLTILVAETPQGRGVLGVVDGGAAKGVESEADVRERRAQVRRFGYKL